MLKFLFKKPMNRRRSVCNNEYLTWRLVVIVGACCARWDALIVSSFRTSSKLAPWQFRTAIKNKKPFLYASIDDLWNSTNEEPLSANAPVVGITSGVVTKQTLLSNQAFEKFLGEDTALDYSSKRRLLSKWNPFRGKSQQMQRAATEDISFTNSSTNRNSTSYESIIRSITANSSIPNISSTAATLPPMDNEHETEKAIQIVESSMNVQNSEKKSLFSNMFRRKKANESSLLPTVTEQDVKDEIIVQDHTPLYLTNENPKKTRSMFQRSQKGKKPIQTLVPANKIMDSEPAALTLRRLLERELKDATDFSISNKKNSFSVTKMLWKILSPRGLRGKIKYLTLMALVFLMAPIPTRFSSITPIMDTSTKVTTIYNGYSQHYNAPQQPQLQKKEEEFVYHEDNTNNPDVPAQFAGSGRSAVLGEPRIPTSSSSPSNEGRNYISTFVSDAVRKIGPSVIRIDTERFVEGGGFFPQRQQQGPFFGFDDEEEEERSIEQGQGSGIIFSSEGYVLTNAHVVEGASRVTVTLIDGRKFRAEVKGSDEMVDLAVLQLLPKEDSSANINMDSSPDKNSKMLMWDGKPLPVAPLGNSDSVQVGEWALAIGNPVGLDNTVTIGIISAVKRSSSEVGIPQKKVAFFQTDCAINPGNSGGALVNEHGDVIGINTCIRANAEGIGFAIPINKAKNIMYQLAEGKSIQHGYIGIIMSTITPDMAKQINNNPNSPSQMLQEVHGALVMRVNPNTPASECGLRRHDVLFEIGGKRVKTAAEAQAIVDNAIVGKELELKVFRGGQEMTLFVKPADLGQKMKEAKEKERLQQQQQQKTFPPGSLLPSPGRILYFFPITPEQ